MNKQEQRIISEIARLSKSQGIEFKKVANGHYQIKGALLVNYYPFSVGKTAYVSGTTGGIKNVTPKQAFKMSRVAPSVRQGMRKDKRSGGSRRKRQKLLDKGVTCCHWCGVGLCIDSSTLEHIIPLARAGLDNENNLTLACEPCNSDRGDNMPELKKRVAHES